MRAQEITLAQGCDIRVPPNTRGIPETTLCRIHMITRSFGIARTAWAVGHKGRGLLDAFGDCGLWERWGLGVYLEILR